MDKVDRAMSARCGQHRISGYERLRVVHGRLWHWTRISIIVTGILFAGAWVCDHFGLAPKFTCLILGSLSLCSALALVIVVSLVEGASAIVDPKRTRPLEIVGILLFNALLIALLGLMLVAILAGLFTNR
jgi:hypothetical protein